MLRDYNKYIVITRPLTCGKMLVRQGDDGVDLMSTDPNKDRWRFWMEYKKFRRVWIEEALNKNSSEYEEGLIIKSFDDLTEAHRYLESIELRK